MADKPNKKPKTIRVPSDRRRDVFLEKRKENVRDDFFQQVRDSN